MIAPTGLGGGPGGGATKVPTALPGFALGFAAASKERGPGAFAGTEAGPGALAGTALAAVAAFEGGVFPFGTGKENFGAMPFQGARLGDNEAQRTQQP